ncbi:MAG: ankyrin repeat domain-containing protein [Alphaproteobacteria bacterium]
MSRLQLTPEEYTDWFDAARNGNEETVREMAQKYPGIVNTTSYEGASALLTATEEQRNDIVVLLLTLGAQIDLADEQGATPLITTACTGAAGTMKLLLEKGAQVESRFGEALSTPLHCAAHNGNLECVKLLIENGADIMAKTGKGLTALEEARRTGAGDCAKYLELEMTRRHFADEAQMLTGGLVHDIKVGHKITLKRRTRELAHD